MDALAHAVVHATEVMLADSGFVQAPTCHMLGEHQQAYLGYLTSRPFYPGEDAATAIRLLGVLPSVLHATRLVVTWESADLRVALDEPGATFPNAVAVLDADLDGHVLRWYPFDLAVGPINPDNGCPTAAAQWGTAGRYPNHPLPEPVTALLAVWRAGWDEDVDETVATLEAAHYRIRWAA